jgi:hypothetical protein
MSKFLLNLLLQISKALVNLKIQFLIQKFFFLTFGPADLVAHSAFDPAGSRWPLLSHRPKPTGRPKRSARARRWRNCRSALSPLIHAFCLNAFSLSSADAWVPHVSPVFPTAPADPGRISSAPRMPPSLYRPPSLSPLIPFKPRHNEP